MRRARYIGVAAVYEGASVRSVEQLVRAHRLPGQVRFHARNESDARRRGFLRDCIECGLVRVWVYEAPFPAKPARRAIVSALTVDAVKRDVGRMVLERGDPERDHLDRQDIERSLKATGGDIPYSHDPPGSYAGLEIADVAAWAHGARGLWTREVTPLIEFIRDLDP